MSYILDALRKADAQRERDSSRGIHAQAAPLGAATAEGGPAGRAGCMAVVAAAAVIAIAAGWYFTRNDRPPPGVAVAPAVAPATMRDMPAPAGAISPPPPAPVARPMATPTPAQAREAAFMAQGQGQAQGPSPGQLQAVPPTGGQVSPPSPAAAPVAGGLPPDAPRIAISGGVYSPSAAQRMLIVNGQVFNEGSEVAPGVKVEAIQARTAILSFRGSRYTVAY